MPVTVKFTASSFFIAALGNEIFFYIPVSKRFSFTSKSDMNRSSQCTFSFQHISAMCIYSLCFLFAVNKTWVFLRFDFLFAALLSVQDTIYILMQNNCLIAMKDGIPLRLSSSVSVQSTIPNVDYRAPFFNVTHTCGYTFHLPYNPGCVIFPFSNQLE